MATDTLTVNYNLFNLVTILLLSGMSINCIGKILVCGPKKLKFFWIIIQRKLGVRFITLNITSVYISCLFDRNSINSADFKNYLEEMWSELENGLIWFIIVGNRGFLSTQEWTSWHCKDGAQKILVSVSLRWTAASLKWTFDMKNRKHSGLFERSGTVSFSFHVKYELYLIDEWKKIFFVCV
jgi:hypothetical protein